MEARNKSTRKSLPGIFSKSVCYFSPPSLVKLPICKYLFDEWHPVNLIKIIPNVHPTGNSVKITVTALVEVEESVVKNNPWNLVTLFKYLDNYVADTETSF